MVSLCFFVLLLYVFDIFRSVLTNYKMILLLSIQFHGFRIYQNACWQQKNYQTVFYKDIKQVLFFYL